MSTSFSNQGPRIPDIAYPPEYLEDLKRLSPLMIERMGRDGLPIQNGEIKLGKLDPALDISYFYFTWVCECNDVIESLNLTIVDIRALPRRFPILGGSPWARYSLLVRLYFHEFYRFREIFNAVMSACVKRRFISKEELSAVRNVFHAAIEEAIRLRNSIVHDRPKWTGDAHFELNLASMAYNRGMRLVSRESGEILSIEATLDRACTKVAAVLQEEGEKVSLIMNAFVRDLVAISGRIPSS